MTLEEKHLQAISSNADENNSTYTYVMDDEGLNAAAKECAKITLQFGIGLLTDASKYGQNIYVDELNADIEYLEQQLSDLNK